MKIALSIILFIVALGVLVTIHEFGHFIAAKSFKVYCEEFSIGFGPRFLRIGNEKDNENKKKSLIYIPSKKETAFNLAIIPLGGYVAMLGEGSDEMAKNRPDLKGRSINEKGFWKRLTIYFGGIIMNFVLAWIMFVIAFGCFTQVKNYGYNVFSVSENTTFNSSLTYDYDGLDPYILDFNEYTVDKNNEITKCYMLDVYTVVTDETEYEMLNNYDEPVTIVGNDSKFVLVFNSTNASLNDIDYSNCFSIVAAQEVSVKKEDGSEAKVFIPKVEDDSYVYHQLDKNEVINPIKVSVVSMIGDDFNANDAYLHLSVGEDGTLNRVGFGIYVREYKNTLIGAIKEANSTWVSSTKLIGKSLISLFYDKSTWKQLGGPIAIYSQTSMILNNYPFSYYLQTWGMISVNLALFNFLPFPGLDGWAILVCVIEGIVNLIKNPKKKAKKNKKDENLKEYVIGEEKVEEEVQEWKIPAKVKGLISSIGLLLVFALMAVIVVKDILGLF